MAVTVAGVSNGAIGAATRMSITRPAGARSGDLLVASTYVEAPAVASIPSGWTAALAAIIGGANDWMQNVWWRLDDGSPGPWEVTWDGSSVFCDWTCVALRGQDTARPINAARGQANASSRSMVAPSITTTVDGCQLMFVGAIGGPTTATPPAGMTEVADNAPCYAADEPQAVAGATGTRTATLASAQESTAVLVAIAPLVVTGATIAHYDGAAWTDRALNAYDGSAWRQAVGLTVL